MSETDPTDRVRIGAVRYLNSKPLIEGLPATIPGAELVLDVPSRLADDLAAGKLDVALIPSVEAFSDANYVAVSDACVATRGPVLSVKLYSRVHPGQIRTLALDEGSRTSAALVKILLEERYGVTPQVESLPLQATTRDTSADAVLLIGDRAIHPPEESFHTVWDLGTEWSTWTGLPFVFAMWVARRDRPGVELGKPLGAVRDRGLDVISDIARREGPQLGMSQPAALEYLTKNLHFHLGSAERNGLQLFRKLATRLGLVPDLGHTLFAPSPSRIASSPVTSAAATSH
ncbi:menaquinone biosynthetic enzyme MqnA/MqnD family protein [Maioricimonas rarisocia]|nr:menaquinone biosynthesis protein [Maioricimonas rarisocia]